MIRLHIEELVLHGFDPRDRRALADAIRTELARRFTSEPLPVLRSREAIDAGEVRIDSLRSRGAGAAVASAIHQGVAK